MHVVHTEIKMQWHSMEDHVGKIELLNWLHMSVANIAD